MEFILTGANNYYEYKKLIETVIQILHSTQNGNCHCRTNL